MAYILCMPVTAADREFFGALADVVFGNPFSVQRGDLVARLVPAASRADLTRDREALARVVSSRLPEDLDRLAAQDRRLIEPALLYICYHRAVPQLDALIERQARQSGAPLTVSFADEVLGELARNGFP